MYFATLPWKTLDLTRKVSQDKVTRGCTKTHALSLSGCTSLIFVNPGTMIDGYYYCDIVLLQQMLPSIRSIAGDAYVFQQDSAPVHHVRQTVEILTLKLQHSLLQTHGLQIVLILTP